jgi:hypothetical protein
VNSLFRSGKRMVGLFGGILMPIRFLELVIYLNRCLESC